MTTDNLTNVVSGMGTAKSKRESYEWKYSLLNSFEQMDAAFQSSWLARQIVEIPAEDMTREWRRIKSSDAEQVERTEKRLLLQHNVTDALIWARLFGGSGILMLTGQELTKPLDINKVKKDDLTQIIVFDRWELGATEINTYDVLAPNFLKPERYQIQGTGQEIHWTHIVRFVGEKLPRRQMAQTTGWGDSVLRKCLQDLNDIVGAHGGVAELMTEANIDIITKEDLGEDLASEQDKKIVKRYELFSQMKSIFQLALLDGKETLDRKTLNLSGFADVLNQFMTWISGASRVPVTKLFGTSAKGMNATGEGDMKTYYDDIRAMQMSKIGLPLQTLDEVLVRSALGYFPDDYDYEWNPLSQPNNLEKSQATHLKAQVDMMYLDSGIIQRSQIQRELQADEQYQFDDEKIAELEDLEQVDLFENQPIVEGS